MVENGSIHDTFKCFFNSTSYSSTSSRNYDLILCEWLNIDWLFSFIKEGVWFFKWQIFAILRINYIHFLSFIILIPDVIWWSNSNMLIDIPFVYSMEYRLYSLPSKMFLLLFLSNYNNQFLDKIENHCFFFGGYFTSS